MHRKIPFDYSGSAENALGPLGGDRFKSGKSGAYDFLRLRTLAVVVRRSEGLPIRDIVTGRKLRSVGEYVSLKSQIRQPWESSHERLAHCLDEVDPEIAQTLAQPHRLVYSLDGTKHFYTPDVELWTERGHFVREIKEETELRDNPDLERKFAEIERTYAVFFGIKFQLLTDRKIRIEPRLANTMTVQKRRRLKIPWECEQRLIDHLRDRDGESSFSDCARALKAVDQGGDFLMAAMCRRLVRLDFSKPLSQRTTVFRHNASDPSQPTLAIRRNVRPYR